MKCRHCGTELKLPLVDRIDHLYQDRHEQNVRFFLHHGDMTDSSSLIRNIQQIQPDEIYNYHPENSHVIPALIRKFHAAKQSNAPSVTVWGTGTPRREFLYSDDMADACVFLMKLPDAEYQTLLGSDEAKTGRFEPPLVNIGTGTDVTIKELAEIIKCVDGYEGEVVFDPTKPDGTPRKLMDVSRLRALGWRARTGLKEGLAGAYAKFLG